jgi:homoserine dehydrogenase
MKSVRIAIAGLGNVGAGVGQLLEKNHSLIADHTNCDIQISAVSARSKTKDRGFDLSNVTWHEDPLHLLNDKPDILCELVGGDEGVAYELVRAALLQKIPVVTANKALMSKHGVELAQLAEQNNVPLCFEGAVAGGIPVIKLIREGLAANKISKLYGILNGTCNYILTTMQSTGRSFDDVLSEAQAKGYAEANPMLDVDGFDTAHKLSLLVALAFGVNPDTSHMPIFGIRPIKSEDIHVADELGYRIKLIGSSSLSPNGKILQSVEPSLVPKTSSLAHVPHVLNAVYTIADPVGSSFIEGRGAGAGPTASAVVADIIDVLNNRCTYPFLKPIAKIKAMERLPDKDFEGSYYVRLMVKDQPGVIADISAILRDQKISIESLIQRGRDPLHPVMVVFTTHECMRDKLLKAMNAIGQLDTVSETPFFMPILDI